MDFNKFKEVVKDIKGIVTSQTQVRTNKLKPLAVELEDFVTYFESLPTPAPAEEAPAPAEDLTKENRYLKRKITMYDLKIAKLEKEAKKWKALAKVNDTSESGE